MDQNLRRNSLNWLLIIIGVLLLATRGEAVKAFAANEGPGFSVTPILPSNQLRQNVSYFDLLVTPNQRQVLQLKITNDQPTAQTFTVGIHSAYTTSSGVISFDRSQKNLPPMAVETLITGPDEITVAANTSQLVAYTLTAPASTFIGVISGGFYLSPKQETTKQANNIQNAVAMGISIILRQDLASPNPPKLELTAARFDAKMTTPALNVTMTNPSANQFGEIAIKYRLYKVGQKKAVFSATDTHFASAPHNTFTRTLALKIPTLSAGRYQLDWEANSGTFHWQRRLALIYTAKAAATKNGSPAKSLPRAATQTLIIGILVGMGAVALIWLFWHYRQQRR